MRVICALCAQATVVSPLVLQKPKICITPDSALWSTSFSCSNESKHLWSSYQDPYSFNITFTIYRRKTSDRNPEVLFKGNRTKKKSIMTFKIIDYIALLTLELRNLTNWILKSYCSHLYNLEDLFSI